MKQFGEVLKDLREEMGHTQRELAEGSGLSYETIRAYEYGRRKPTQLLTVYKLIEGLEIDLDTAEADRLIGACFQTSTGHMIGAAQMLKRLATGKLN